MIDRIKVLEKQVEILINRAVVVACPAMLSKMTTVQQSRLYAMTVGKNGA